MIQIRIEPNPETLFLMRPFSTKEPFSEAESAPIRSAVKFYFDIDVRIIPTFFWSIEKIFSIDQKKVANKIGNFHQLFFFVKWISLYKEK